MNRSEILDKAKEIVTKDRQATHGNAEDNFATIAAMWEAYINAACIAGDNYDLCIAPKDVAVMQILLKIARAASNPLHLDNWLDICGYGACGGAIATGTEAEEIKPGGSENEN